LTDLAEIGGWQRFSLKILNFQPVYPVTAINLLAQELTPKSSSTKLTKNFLSSSQIRACPPLLGANLDL